jgi:hypothetical protein
LLALFQEGDINPHIPLVSTPFLFSFDIIYAFKVDKVSILPLWAVMFADYSATYWAK